MGAEKKNARGGLDGEGRDLEKEKMVYMHSRLFVFRELIDFAN